MSTYFVVRVDFKKEEISLLGEIEQKAISSWGCDGVQEYSLDESDIDEILGDKAFGGGNISEEDLNILEGSFLNRESIQIDFFFYNENANKRARDFGDFLKTHYSHLPFQIEEAEMQDWNENWRENFQPIIVSDNLKVIPSWQKEEYSSDPNCIFIYPGQGFGTGGHETTFLCLEIFDQIRKTKSFKNCLDFGCGSGILGIGALKNGVDTVHFCDVDVNALENCRQNFKFNEIIEDGEKALSFLREDFNRTHDFDLVFANIIENILLREKRILSESTASGGSLIVSGLLKGQENNIIKDFTDFKVIEIKNRGDWVGILFEKL